MVRRGDTIILATEGLSDPFDDTEGMGNGFEMELFVETADIPEHAYGPVGEVDPFKGSWAFELLEHVAKTVADAGGITHQLDQYGTLSLELPGLSQSHHMGDQLPKLFVTDDDSTGVLLGAPEPDFSTQLDDMLFVPGQIGAGGIDYGGGAGVRAFGRASGAGGSGESFAGGGRWAYEQPVSGECGVMLEPVIEPGGIPLASC